MITIEQALTFSPLRLPAFKTWADRVWNCGLWHGLELSELLGTPTPGKPGDVDCVATADQLLRLAEAAGWIVRGKMELHGARRHVAKGHAGKEYPVDHCWMPNRSNPGLFDIVFPNMAPETRERCAIQYGWPAPVVPVKAPAVKRRMVQLPLFDEVAK